MKQLLTTICVLLCTIASFAQPGWNWPEDETTYNQALEKQAYYKVLMGQDKYGDALEQLNWLYEKNGNLNPSIYIDGVKCLEKMIKETSDASRIAALQDSALWMFDQRIKHFENAASVKDRKAYTAFKYHYKNSKRYPLLIELYDEAMESNGSATSKFNLSPIMMIAKYSYERKLPEMPADKVLDVHSKLTEIMDDKEKNGEDITEERNKVDAFLSSIEGLLSCEYIEKNLVPRLESNPNDLNTAKKIFSYSLQAKCSDQEYFMKAAEVIGKEERNFKLAKILGDNFYGKKDYSRADEYYKMASELAENDQDGFDALMGQARTANRRGQKSTARSLARQALSKKPGAKEAYDLIGNLYFGSFEDCAEKKSKVQDRAVFLVAYDMYKRAGNQKQMSAAKEQFPTIEDMFTEGFEEGAEITVNCWINEKTILRRR